MTDRLAEIKERHLRNAATDSDVGWLVAQLEAARADKAKRILQDIIRNEDA